MNNTNQNNETSNQNISDIVNMFSRVNDTFTYPIYIPSLDKEVMFKQMTTAQQKTMVKTLINNNEQSSEYLYTIYDVIKSNCADPEVNIDELTLLDKMFVCIRIRTLSIGSSVEVMLNTIKDDSGNSIPITVDLDNVYMDMKKQLTTEYKMEIKDDNVPFSVGVDLPTLRYEFKLEKELQEGLKKKFDTHKQNTPEMKNAIGEMFIYEISKYVSYVTVASEEDGETVINRIDVNDMSCKQKIKIIEALPNSLISKLVTQVNEITTRLNSYSLLNLEHNGEKHTYQLEVTSNSFFIPS